MIYLWASPENFKNRDVGDYDRSCSPDRFLLREGRILNISEFTPVPTVHFDVPQKRILSFDCLPNNANCPLVNERVKQLLENLAPNDVQFFPAKCLCSDGELTGYYYMNITRLFTGIDHGKSEYSKMQLADAISGFRYLTYKPGCMGNYHLARDQEYKSHLLVSETIKVLFDKERVTGVWLVPPETYYP